MKNYNPFEEDWEKEMNKLSKKELINMIRIIQTGTKEKSLCKIETITEAQNAVECIINDFEAGVSTKSETLGLLGEYTARLMELFWKNAKKQFKQNQKLLEE